MEIKDAIAEAEKNNDVQEHMKNGFYLSSVMTIPEQLKEITQWTLVYFHPEDKQVFSVEVTKDSVKKGEPTDPLVEAHYGKLDYTGALNSKELISKIVVVLAEQREFPTKVIITLRENEWKIAILTKSLHLLRLDLEKETGEIKKTEKSSLISTV